MPRYLDLTQPLSPLTARSSDHPEVTFRTLLPKGILMIENLGGEIDQLIGRRATMFALPPKYEGVEAAPVRAIAVLDD